MEQDAERKVLGSPMSVSDIELPIPLPSDSQQQGMHYAGVYLNIIPLCYVSLFMGKEIN